MLLYDRLANIPLRGAVIDLGGSRKSAYLKNFTGDYTLTVANLEAEETRDVLVDLEQPFSIADAQYDVVLCINVLEHIYHFQNIISETKRILKPGGEAIFAVPFLVQIHPSPHDHWRFTAETLERLFSDTGFKEVKVEAIGTGVFGASAQIKFNLLKLPILRFIANTGATALDHLVTKSSKGKNFSKEFYPLGYVVSAKN